MTTEKAICSGTQHAKSNVDANFEQRLIECTRPIAEHYLAFCLHHIFSTGIYDELLQSPKKLISDIAKNLNLEIERLTGLLLYLSNEGIVQVNKDSTVFLTEKGKSYGEFKAWYTIMIGGYSTTISQIGLSLAKNSPFCTRDGRYVGLGSCEMSRFDGMPITKTLLEKNHLKCSEILDLGCGNALYLVDFCRSMPELRAWGVEPSPGGYEEARRLVHDAGMEDRVSLYNSSSIEFIEQAPDQCQPDLMVLGFVLHEILAQEGEKAVIHFLKSVVNRFPKINIIVIEVINEIDNPIFMRHALAKNFWNPYYLIHYFTLQRLEKKHFWERLFELSGLNIVDHITTDFNVDSSLLEWGYLLKRI